MTARSTINRAQPSDQDAIISLLAAQMAEHHLPSNRKALERVVHQVLTDDWHGFFIVARVGSETVGVAYVPIIFSIEHGGRAGWLEELYVVPAHREQGIGSSLLDEVIRQARELVLIALDLEVDASHQRAERFYTRHGFRQLSRSRWVRKI